MRQQGQIESAAYQYTDNVMPDICRNMDEDIYRAFIAGVEWADEHPNLSSLWHEANEKPTEEYGRILCESSEDEIFDAYLLKINSTYQSDWKAFIKECDVVRWAYLWDILP